MSEPKTRPPTRVAPGKFTRRYLDVDVLTATRQRISDVFEQHERVCVSFSGGKDSGVLLHLVMEEAVRRGRRVTVLFIDWEAQYELTIRFVRDCMDMYDAHLDPLWVCLPLVTVNACSAIEPEWTCWDPAKRDLWVREPPWGRRGVVCEEGDALRPEVALPFYRHGMTFEDFIEGFEAWFGGAIFVGIRAAESYDRYLGTFVRLKVAKATGGVVQTVCPIYDWRTEDIWTYGARFGKPYNQLYDRMYQAGLSIHKMRVCEPYGNEQRQGLWQFHVIEPETWGRVCARVAGANTGALYAGERGNVMGNVRVTLPAGHTWKSFSLFLLDTMPSATAEHYRNKIAVYLKWYQDHGVPELPDAAEGDTGSKDKGTWRRICRSLLKHDFWMMKCGFSPNKTHAYAAYQEMMRKRREKWGIFPSKDDT